MIICFTQGNREWSIRFQLQVLHMLRCLSIATNTNIGEHVITALFYCAIHMCAT